MNLHLGIPIGIKVGILNEWQIAENINNKKINGPELTIHRSLIAK
jgi:hypothetical protein